MTPLHHVPRPLPLPHIHTRTCRCRMFDPNANANVNANEPRDTFNGTLHGDQDEQATHVLEGEQKRGDAAKNRRRMVCRSCCDGLWFLVQVVAVLGVTWFSWKWFLVNFQSSLSVPFRVYTQRELEQGVAKDTSDMLVSYMKANPRVSCGVARDLGMYQANLVVRRRADDTDPLAFGFYLNARLSPVMVPGAVRSFGSETVHFCDRLAPEGWSWTNSGHNLVRIEPTPTRVSRTNKVNVAFQLPGETKVTDDIVSGVDAVCLQYYMDIQKGEFLCPEQRHSDL